MATEDINTPTGAANQDDGTQPDASPAPNAGGTDPKLVPQDEMDRVIADRLARNNRKWEAQLADAVKKGISEFRDERGLDDDTLNKLAGMDEHQAEVANLQAQLAEADARREEFEGKFTQTSEKLKTTLTRTAVLAEAAGKSNDPELVWLSLKKRVGVDDSMNPVVYGDDGKPAHGSSIEQVVNELLESKPHLKAPTPSANGANSRPGTNAEKPAQKEKLLTAEGRKSGFESVGQMMGHIK